MVMMRRILCAIKDSTVIAVLAITITASQANCERMMDDADLNTFDGSVVSVDRAHSTLTVDGGVTRIFPVSSRTRITRDIYDIELSDVKVGDYVRVGYRKADDGSVDVLSVVVEYEPGDRW